MTARRFPSAVLPALLAFIAVLGMTALSGWHSASFHVDEPAHHAAAAAHEDTNERDSSDNVVHLAAHSVGTAVAIPGGVVTELPSAIITVIWPALDSVAPDGLDPASLLRPPRA